MKATIAAIVVIMSSIILPPAYAAPTSTELATAMRKAIEAKDIKLADALVDWRNAPPQVYRLFRMTMADCFEASCKIELATISKEDLAGDPSYTFPTPPEGQLKIISADNSETTKLPFANVGGVYKIIVANLTPEATAAAKTAANSQRVAEDLDPDLIQSGQKLPADGGDPAKAYREYLAAIARKDASFLATSGSAADRYLFSKAYQGKPKKAAIALDLLQLENPTEAIIESGFEKDGRAILLVRGTLGNGWPAAGAVALDRSSGK